MSIEVSADINRLTEFRQRLQPIIKTVQLWFAVGLAIAVLVHGCTLGGQTPQPLRIGINSWPGYAIAYYAQNTGLFETRGLEVELIHFNNQQDNIRATLRGALDASFVPLWEVLQADPGEEQPVVLMVADISAGSDGIVAAPGIHSVADLRGKKVGVKLGTVPHLVLLEALETEKIVPKEVEVVDVSNDIGIQQLKDGQLDAAVVWEPTLSETANQLGSQVIFTTADVDSLVIDGFVSRRSFVKKHPKRLKQFMLAWFDAIHAVESNPDDVFKQIGQHIGQSQEAFAAAYAGLKKGDRAMNQRMFREGRLLEATQQISTLLDADSRHNRIIRNDIELDATLVEEAMRSWQP